MGLLLLILSALAGSLIGETLRWEIQFAGVSGGEMWCSVEAGAGEAVTIEAGVRSADWYARLYPIDDLVRSTWTPGHGSARYETRFREGRFHQDQDMRLSGDPFTVWRRQEFAAEGWREWEKEYPGRPGVQDPVSAVYALRLLTGEGPWTYPVFSGEETWPLQVEKVAEDHLEDTPVGAVDVLVLSLRTLHEGDWEQQGRFLMYVTDDARRIPVRFIVKTSIGSVRANLIEYTPPR